MKLFPSRSDWLLGDAVYIHTFILFISDKVHSVSVDR